MSERFTTIRLPGVTSWSERGHVDVDRMVEIYQENARRDLEEAETILMALPSDFQVLRHDGVHVWRNVLVLQEGVGRR